MQQCVFWIVPLTKTVFWQPLLKYKALMTNRCFSRTLHLQPPHKHKHRSNTRFIILARTYGQNITKSSKVTFIVIRTKKPAPSIS